MLLAMGHVSSEIGIRIDPRVLGCALKWEGDEHEQTEAINKAFRTKAYRQVYDDRWLTSVEPQYMNVLQQFEIRHDPVLKCVWIHGFWPDIARPFQELS